jgi:hypothetical protein
MLSYALYPRSSRRNTKATKELLENGDTLKKDYTDNYLNFFYFLISLFKKIFVAFVFSLCASWPEGGTYPDITLKIPQKYHHKKLKNYRISRISLSG